MKTRSDLYSGEASELLRVVSEYKTLPAEQVLKLFPGREDKIRTLIYNLRQQRRIWASRDGRTLMAAENIEADAGTLKAFRVLLDFIDRVEYHSAGSFPVTLSFFSDAELYEVVYVTPEQEALICHSLSGQTGENGKRIVIVEDAGQIEKLNIPGTVGFCTVSDKGAIQYYQRK